MMNISSGSPACHCHPDGFMEFVDWYFHQSRVATSNSLDGWVFIRQKAPCIMLVLCGHPGPPLGLAIGAGKKAHFSDLILHPNCGNRWHSITRSLKKTKRQRMCWSPWKPGFWWRGCIFGNTLYWVLISIKIHVIFSNSSISSSAL